MNSWFISFKGISFILYSFCSSSPRYFAVRMKVLQIHRELEQDGKPITADVLKRRYYGEGDSPKMLLEVFREHNRKYRELMGKDYVAGTVLRYERTAKYLGTGKTTPFFRHSGCVLYFSKIIRGMSNRGMSHMLSVFSRAFLIQYSPLTSFIMCSYRKC